MEKVIVVVHQKGGIGKGTIACNVAMGTRRSSINFNAFRSSDYIQSIELNRRFVLAGSNTACWGLSQPKRRDTNTPAQSVVVCTLDMWA